MIDQASSLIALNRQGADTPIVFVHPAGGQIHWFRQIAKQMKGQRPCYAFMSMGLLNDDYSFISVEDMAQFYVDTLINQIKGPCIIAGWSFGCDVAFEMTKTMTRLGIEVPLLLLVDPQVLLYSSEELIAAFLDDVLKKEFSINISSDTDLSVLCGKPLDEILSWLYTNILLADSTKNNQASLYLRSIRVYLFNMLAKLDYRKQGKVNKIALSLADNDKLYAFLKQASKEEWHSYCDDISEQIIPGDHYSMLQNESSVLIHRQLELAVQRISN